MTLGTLLQNGVLVIISNKLRAVAYRLGSLRWKLTFSYVFICMVPLFFYANTTLRTMDDAYTAEKVRELLNYANRIASYITYENFLFEEKPQIFDGYIREERSKSSNRIVVVDTSGRIVNDSSWADASWWAKSGQILLNPVVLSALDKKSSWSLQSNKEYMDVAVSISSRGQNAVAGAVLIISSVADKNELMHSMGKKLALLTFLLGIIVLIMVFFISQIIIEPMKNILTTIKKISEGHLNQRVKFYGHDEFTELGASFNDMAERLEKVDEARSEFVSNVSHELKTPLSSVKVLSESLLLQDDVSPGVYREFLSDINSEVDRMTKIINDLLALVLLDRTEQSLSMSALKLNNTIEGVIKRLKPFADQRGIVLYFNDTEVVTVEGDEMKLELVLSNLIENGLKYTNTGGSVVVALESDSQNAVVTVRDTGIGISEADQGKIFNRFYRVDKTRGRETGGTGLGLSIAYKIILLHNGNLRVSSKENEGSSFIIKLPLGSKAALREVH